MTSHDRASKKAQKKAEKSAKKAAKKDYERKHAQLKRQEAFSAKALAGQKKRAKKAG
jgi:hypothetical protein